MVEYTMYGGYSYAIGEPELFVDVREACKVWAERHDSNGIRRVDGLFYPTWGDMDDDDYAITTEYDGLTKSEVMAVADGGDLPFGWE